ncbi:MAG: hypothetical protein E7547_02770 [Ruminococcaceae bacterium]|nr:hypothetical protein [Oscillospiraceae bacterium]
MLETGYIKLHRSILNWEWYGDTVTKSLFLHLLLTVNIKDARWQGVDVPRGARVCSLTTLSEETGFSVKQIRVSLDKLIGTGEVTRSKFPKFSIISIQNWNKFQTEGRQQGTGRAQSRALEGQQNKNNKKKEDKIDTKKVSILSGEEGSVYREVGANDWDD